MDLYTDVSYAASRLVTVNYSTSFSSSTRLFPRDMRQHIYAIYGLVRIADEIVDTYRGPDTAQLLHAVEQEVYEAITRQYSPNPVIHAFAMTARTYGISRTLIEPFFVSMMMDVDPLEFTDKLYDDYIYGSAEVVGLMCLRVFVAGDDTAYGKLEKGARALGAAYQKVNFLRDLSSDYKELGRIYFPGCTFETFDDKAKDVIIKDIENDFSAAHVALKQLPPSSQRAVELSYRYYGELLNKLKSTPASTIKATRIRINNFHKTLLFVRVTIQRVLRGRA